MFRRVSRCVRFFEQSRVCTHFHPRKQAWAVCAGGVEDRVDNVLETLVWLRFLRFSSLFRGRKRKQDKRLASEPTLCPVTSARSAGS